MGGMPGPTTVNPFEVYCTRCRVSFPVGTRTCMHCGHPIASRPAGAAVVMRSGASDEEAAEELPLHGLKASPLTILWLLAGVATVAYRACSS